MVNYSVCNRLPKKNDRIVSVEVDVWFCVAAGREMNWFIRGAASGCVGSGKAVVHCVINLSFSSGMLGPVAVTLESPTSKKQNANLCTFKH